MAVSPECLSASPDCLPPLSAFLPTYLGCLSPVLLLPSLPLSCLPRLLSHLRRLPLVFLAPSACVLRFLPSCLPCVGPSLAPLCLSLGVCFLVFVSFGNVNFTMCGAGISEKSGCLLGFFGVRWVLLHSFDITGWRGLPPRRQVLPAPLARRPLLPAAQPARCRADRLADLPLAGPGGRCLEPRLPFAPSLLAPGGHPGRGACVPQGGAERGPAVTGGARVAGLAACCPPGLGFASLLR